MMPRSFLFRRLPVAPLALAGACLLAAISTARGECGVGDSPGFTLDTRSPRLRFEQPVDGDTLLCSDVVQLAWSSVNATEAVAIEIWRTPLSSWQPLIAGLPPTGTRAWTVTGPETDLAWLRVHAPGQPDLGDTVQVSVATAAVAGRVAGLVVHADNAPFVGAAVSLNDGYRTTTSGASGDFWLYDVPRGLYALAISAPGHQPLVGEIQVDAAVEAYTLYPAGTTTFHCEDRDGQPLGGVNVSFPGSGHGMLTSAADGTAVLVRNQAQALDVVVEKSGFVRQQPRLGAGTVDTTLVLDRTQFSVPTAVFLIRGLDRRCHSPMDDDPELWALLESSLNARFATDSNFACSRIAIRPTDGLYENAQRLNDQIEEGGLPDEACLILVGHSMGGLIARLYAASGYGRSNAVRRVITIDTPHCGAGMATGGSMLNLLLGLLGDCNYEALLELQPLPMSVFNSSWVEHERTAGVEYLLLATTHCPGVDEIPFSGCGDYIVGLRSQLAYDIWPFGSIFGDDDAWVKRKIFDHSEFSVFDPWLHMHAPQLADVAAYVVDNLNVQLAAVPADDLSASRDVALDHLSLVLGEEASLAPAACAGFELSLPPTSRLAGAILLGGAGSWTITAPSGTAYGDPAAIEAAGGVTLLDSLGVFLQFALPEPASGTWRVDICSDAASDTLPAAVRLFADLPLGLRAEPVENAFDAAQGWRLAARVGALAGVAVDTVAASDQAGNRWILRDDGAGGDEQAGDQVYSAWSGGDLPPGTARIRYSADAHLADAALRALDDVEVDVPTEPLYELGPALLLPADTTAQGRLTGLRLRVELEAPGPLTLSAAAWLAAADGARVASASALERVPAGPWTLALAFPGEAVAASRRNGPYRVERLTLSARAGSALGYSAAFADLAASDSLGWNDFAERLPAVEDFAVARAAGGLVAYWAPHPSAGLLEYRLHYGPGDSLDFAGEDLAEGPSPIAVPAAQSQVTLHGASDELAYRFAIQAVDTTGLASPLSPAYRVFPAVVAQAVADLRIEVVEGGVRLVWDAVPGGARYLVQRASSPEGPWSPVVDTFATAQSLTVASPDERRCYRVIAVR